MEKKHTTFFKLIMKWVSAPDTEVIYIRGNHDDFLDEVLPLRLGNFSILRHYIHVSGSKKYFVVHGDIFDSVTTRLNGWPKLGDVGYTFLLWMNRHYNNYRHQVAALLFTVPGRKAKGKAGRFVYFRL